jgi:hypothetical protein
MSEPEKIFVDASQPATLRYSGQSVDCYTLGEAVAEFDRLPEGDRRQATIKVNVPGGATYTAEEIDRLHVAAKGKNSSTVISPAD